MAEGQVVEIAEGNPVANVPVRIATILTNVENILNTYSSQL